MKNKKFLLALLLISLVFLSLQSISANNINDNLNGIETIGSYSDDLSISSYSDDLSIDSYSNNNMNTYDMDSYSDNPDMDSKSNILSDKEDVQMESENIDDEIGLSSNNPELATESSQDKLSSSNQEILSAQDSDPLPDVEQGIVSGGVEFVNVHPWAPSDAVNGNKGNISYTIPSNASIKSAYVYVNVYSGSGGIAYGAYANTTITTANGAQQLGNEYLWTSASSTDGIRYIVNDHVDRVYSDYMIFYNVTDLLQGLNGTSVSVDTISYPMPGKSFDGRIKLVSLFIAWDDGDNDEIYYWLKAGQSWTDNTTDGLYHTFENLPDLDYGEKLSTLINVGISSADAVYFIDGIPIFSENEDDVYLSGAYYQYHKWDISSYMGSDSLEFTYKAVSGAYGPSFKDIISILTIQDIPTYEENVAQISFSPEYSEIPCVYAGTNNTFTIKITTKTGRYNVELLANGHRVNQTEVDFNDGLNTIFLTDPTIRPVNESTVNGGSNENVNYTVKVSLNNKLINASSSIFPILYNGNLGKDLAYPSEGIDYFMNITINGDIVIDVQDLSKYISHNVPNRSETWNVNLDSNSNIVKSFIYIPYYEFNSKTYVEDFNMFNVTFNNVKITPIALYRDQSNLGRDYYSGYGVLLYDVSNLIRNGENVLNLNKKFDTPAVYPSALIYMYNTTVSNTLKEIYIYNGADLLENVYNVANRTVHTDSVIDVNSKLTSNATLYVFAGGPQADEGNLIFNDVLYENIWSATMASNEVYSLDVTDNLRDSNSISFISTGFRIIALQQIMVLTKDLDMLNVDLDSEYPNTCFAGTNNLIFANIDANGEKTVIARLLADGAIVNETEINLKYGSNEFAFIDPTIRAVDELTVNGAQNRIVCYTLQLLEGNNVVADGSIDLNLLYNGNLGKDLAYEPDNAGFIPGGIGSFLNITVTGGLVVDIKDASSYLDKFNKNRNDVWNVNLDSKSNIVKAFVYLPYELADTNLISEDDPFVIVEFNYNQINPIAWYRDQSNLGQKGSNGYGLFVYDVTDLIENGENSFSFTKRSATPNVYPSTLVYMYNTTGSAVIKNIYISNGADLLENINNLAGRAVQSNSKVDIDFMDDGAKLYVFAANAQNGEGDIVFNGERYENVWKGSSHSTDLYILDVSNSIDYSNDISFVAREGSMLALQQILVTTEKAQSKIKAADLTKVYNKTGKLVITLSEANGNVISNANVTVVFNKKTTVLTTDSKGQVTLNIPASLAPNTYYADISYKGDENHLGTSLRAKVTVQKLSTSLSAASVTTVYNTNKKLVITLKDKNGKLLSKAKVTVKLNGASKVLTTNTKGQVTFTVPSNLVPKTYTASISYAGDTYHSKSTASAKVVVKKATVKMTAPKKTFKVKVKTKKYTVTLKNNVNKVMKKVQLSLNVNGKTIKATTNAKGQAIFNIKNLSKKGKYTAKVIYKGDKYYNSLTKKVQITISK